MRATKSPCVECVHETKPKAKQPCRECGERGLLRSFRNLVAQNSEYDLVGSSLMRIDEGAHRRNGNHICW